MPRCGAIVRRGIAALLMGLALLSACGASSQSPGVNATQTAITQAMSAAHATWMAQATRAAAPVWVDVTAQEQGSITQHSAKMIVAVTVTNRTSAPIIPFGTCATPSPYLAISLSRAHFTYSSNIGKECPTMQSVDFGSPIVPGAAYTWPFAISLALYTDGGEVQAGTYLVQAQMQWHQGTLAQATADPPTVLEGKAFGSTTVAVY